MVLATVRDCSEIEKAYEREKNIIKMYDEILTASPDVVWRYEVDANGEFVSGYISPVIDKILGAPRGTIANNFESFFHLLILMT